MATPSQPSAVIRRVHLPDAQAMGEFLHGLSGASRRSRFHGVVNAISPTLLRSLVAADSEQHSAWVACVWGPNGEEIVGEAVWYVVEQDEGLAELAISVRDDWQGKGVADQLMQSLVKSAQEAGMRQLYGDVLQGNARMRSFMRRHGLQEGICHAPDDPGVLRLGCQFKEAAPMPQPQARAQRSWLVRMKSLWR